MDDDFAGGWNKDKGKNPRSVLSRMGYIISYANWPIIWVSRIQTKRALSTKQTKYIALSQAMRGILPFVDIMKEIVFTQTSRRPPDGNVLSFLKSSNCINSLRKQSRINHTRGFPANATLYQKHWYQVPSLPEYQQEW